MPKQSKRKENASSKAIIRIQAATIYTPIIRLRSNESSPLNKHLIKHAFLQFDEESPWELTSNCKVYNFGSGYHIHPASSERMNYHKQDQVKKINNTQHLLR